jgi:hypothetical protein
MENEFIDEPEINFINPCKNNFNKKVLEKRAYAVTKEKRSFGIDVLPPKDRSFVARSSGCVVNLNQYDPDKVLLGSYFELAWYFDSPSKTVIGFADDLNSYLCQHPFVQKTVHCWCQNKEEAAYVLQKYFINR